MYSKFVLAIRFCSAEMAILVGKMANGRLISSSVSLVDFTKYEIHLVSDVSKYILEVLSRPNVLYTTVCALRIKQLQK